MYRLLSGECGDRRMYRLLMCVVWGQTNVSSVECSVGTDECIVC